MTAPFTAPSTFSVSINHEYYKILVKGPLEEHFLEFIENLPEAHRSYYLQQGFKACQQNVLFRHFIQERIGKQLSLLQISSPSVVVKTDTNAVTGVSPNVGPPHTNTSRNILAATIAYFILNKKKAFKIFSFYKYKITMGKNRMLYNSL